MQNEVAQAVAQSDQQDNEDVLGMCVFICIFYACDCVIVCMGICVYVIVCFAKRFNIWYVRQRGLLSQPSMNLPMIIFP